jgi:competence protein ComEC
VRFEFLHPALAAAGAKRTNDLSCVLKVSAGGRSMLLTGDIEKPAEAEMLAGNAAALSADVLLVPHHGSRTSSSEAFLAAVRPAAAVIPVGYRNRFGHPNGEVLGRYSAIDCGVFRTDRDGAVTVRLFDRQLQIETERRRRRRYWQDAPS